MVSNDAVAQVAITGELAPTRTHAKRRWGVNVHDLSGPDG